MARSAALVSLVSGVARMCSSLVTTARRASTHFPCTPAWVRAAATSRELSSSPVAATTSDIRGEASRSVTRVRDHRIELLADLGEVRHQVGVAGRQVRGRGQVALADLHHARVGIGRAARGGVCRHAQQAVGHAAHRRHHDGRPGPVARARGADDLDQASDGFRVGDRRPAEFLHNHRMSLRGEPLFIARVHRRQLVVVERRTTNDERSRASRAHPIGFDGSRPPAESHG